MWLMPQASLICSAYLWSASCMAAACVHMSSSRYGRALGLELAARGLAAVGQQVVGLAEGIRLHDDLARDLIALSIRG